MAFTKADLGCRSQISGRMPQAISGPRQQDETTKPTRRAICQATGKGLRPQSLHDDEILEICSVSLLYHVDMLPEVIRE